MRPLNVFAQANNRIRLLGRQWPEDYDIVTDGKAMRKASSQLMLVISSRSGIGGSCLCAIPQGGCGLDLTRSTAFVKQP